VRVEDLDSSRVRPGIEQGQLADLAALGLDWDEEPVRQSERAGLYADALASLDAAGALYPCFCTRAEIREAAAAPHGPLPEGAYPGACRELTAAQRARRERDGRPPALRVRSDGELIAFSDALHGEQAGVVDDVVVRRNDGARLAKRHGAVTLADRVAAGESPAAVRAWCARSAGLAAEGEDTSPEALVQGFDSSRVTRAPTTWTDG